MEQLFRFWGYGPEVWEATVGPGRLLEVATASTTAPRLGRIKFDRELRDLLPEFESELEVMLGYAVPEVATAAPTGRVLANLEPVGGGAVVPLISQLGDGRYRFHFDVDASIEFVEQERYFATQTPFYVKLGLSPDKLPAIARKTILLAFHASRGLTRGKGEQKPAFPMPRKDFSLDVWRFLVQAMLEANAAPAPLQPLWPEGKRAALILNHDVDTTWGIDAPGGIAAFRALEEQHGLRSAWITITGLHEAAGACLHELKTSGHEIGCHSTVHDHNLAYLPLEGVRARFREAQPFLDEFECAGFRSPSYHRSETLFQGLDGVLDYDMSMHDSFENANSPVPSYEGCSTCFPFQLHGTRVLELPTTVPEDFVLELQGHTPDQAAQIQLDQIRAISLRRGLANLLTHPEPQLSARAGWRACYERVLAEVVSDEQLWIALPREVSAWWNQRRGVIDAAWEAGAARDASC